MKIAILGWGSLCWDYASLLLPQTTMDEVEWIKTPIELPLNCSRISDEGKGRLTIVIDEQTGIVQPVYALIQKVQNPNVLFERLRKREGTSKKGIGSCWIVENKQIRPQSRHHFFNQSKIQAQMEQFAQDHQVKCILWTDLGSNFQEITQKTPTVTNMLHYLDKLRKENTDVYRVAIMYLYLCDRLNHLRIPIFDVLFKKG